MVLTLSKKCGIIRLQSKAGVLESLKGVSCRFKMKNSFKEF